MNSTYVHVEKKTYSVSMLTHQVISITIWKFPPPFRLQSRPQPFQVLCLNAWALSYFFSLVDWVQRCCTELFHVFSLDYSYGSITHTTGRLAHTIKGHGSGNLSIAYEADLPLRTLFVLFRPIKKRSFNILFVLDLFFRTLAVNSVSDFFSLRTQSSFSRSRSLSVSLSVCLSVSVCLRNGPIASSNHCRVRKHFSLT